MGLRSYTLEYLCTSDSNWFYIGVSWGCPVFLFILSFFSYHFLKSYSLWISPSWAHPQACSSASVLTTLLHSVEDSSANGPFLTMSMFESDCMLMYWSCDS